MPIPKVMDQLLLEIEHIDENTFPPKKPIESGERDFGQISVYVRKVWALSAFYSREKAQIEVDRQYTQIDENRLLECARKADVLREMAYYIASMESNADTCCVGIRAGWRLVASAHHGLPPLLKFLGEI